MKTAKVNVGDVLISLPVECLEQQTAISSVFDNVPIDSVGQDELIEANKEGVSWFYKNGRTALQISVPTELIKWEE
jgi:hypothetical protein